MAEILTFEKSLQMVNASGRDATVDHFSLASRYIMNLLKGKRIDYMFLGSWAIYMRGATVKPTHLILSIEGRMDVLLRILGREPRCRWVIIILLKIKGTF